MEEPIKKVFQVLDLLEIPYQNYEHPPVYTIAEMEKYITHQDVQHCKNLFLRNSKGDRHYLLLVEHDKQVNLKKVAKQIGSSRLSFASEERLEKYLGLSPGAVSPFGLIHDPDHKVEVLIDKKLRDRERISFHPNVNTASITLNYEDFEKYLQWCGHTVQTIILDES